MPQKKYIVRAYSPGTRDLSRDDPQAQREQRESATRAVAREGRCGRARVDRSADRRRLFVPCQDGPENVRQRCVLPAFDALALSSKTAGVPPVLRDRALPCFGVTAPARADTRLGRRSWSQASAARGEQHPVHLREGALPPTCAARAGPVRTRRRQPGTVLQDHGFP